MLSYWSIPLISGYIKFNFVSLVERCARIIDITCREWEIKVLLEKIENITLDLLQKETRLSGNLDQLSELLHLFVTDILEN